ncbi:NAD(P)H-dependent glycerol-3-phosphate dehydrogenase [Natranaerofaba carboxydovora]|uniref:NAD(P)H-dependent glycerol-3-phosphate dehydrogenase n=1 Tax=Natranaerofaba carboxydovora TaxID=2742683 RepID=UPI001F141270|nr:NAD(P)H-dependent glycerol-3-phosphate dehydrogenase [Natranaerofaba carboxydovora]UMZ73882.1 Glycerol-3-phosphate dehydrogenase [NAD(P)+] [Natranaerofaba carboxydovora]
MKNERISVIGAGSWGSALSALLSEKGHEVWLWTRRSSLAEELKEKRENEGYLPGVKLPSNLNITSDLTEATKNTDIWLIVVPSHVMTTIAKELKKHLKEDILVVSATKGFDVKTYRTMTQVLSDALFDGEKRRVYALSGPNHAEEVGKKKPSATVIAGKVKKYAERLQKAFMTPYFRVYTNPDLTGVEYGGALKNIVALGAGIADGLGYGDNTKAALLTRGINEIARLGMSYNASVLTFAGLSGVGDLVVTSTSTHSRNYRVGKMLGEGKSLEEILAEMKMVAEGIKTTEAAYKMSIEKDVEMPITQELYDVLFNNKETDIAVKDLMQRVRKNEMEEVVQEDMWEE